MNIRQAVPGPVATAQAGSIVPRTILKSVNVQELVFGFKESPDIRFLVPRDSTLEVLDDRTHLYTFLTLRNQPGGKTLQHQVIPVTFAKDPVADQIVEVMRAHINKHGEVKDKMANAFRHIPRMAVQYLDFGPASQQTSTQNSTGASLEAAAGSPMAPSTGGRKRSQQLAGPGMDRPSTKKKVRVKKKENEKEGKEAEGEHAEEDRATSKKQKKASIIPEGWKCELCGVSTTVMRRRGPSGLNCACNSCGQAWSQANRARSNSEVTKVEEL